MNKVHSQIKSWLEANKDAIVTDVAGALKIYSESYNRPEVEKSLKQLLGVAQKLGFRTEIRAKGEIGVVFFGEGDETLGILAHADVVPTGDPKLWKHSPFGEVSEGRIYGRGSVDNKGMVISSLYAMAAVKALNMPIHKKIELIIGSREEIVWGDFSQYKKEGHVLPDYGFTPDGEFPITNREKGNCEIRMVYKGKDCPGDYEILDIKSGIAKNAIPGNAEARIKGDIGKLGDMISEYNETVPEADIKIEQAASDEATVVATGKAAHSSMPELGNNALTMLCLFLSGLKVKDIASEQFIKFVSEHFNNDFYGSSLGLPQHPEFLNGEEMGKTTVAPTMAYMDGGLNLVLSIRPVYGTKKKEVEDAFEKLSKEYGFSFIIPDYLDPLYVSKDHKFIELLSKVYESVTGEKAGLILAGGTTYAKALPNSVAFGPVFPGYDDVCHQVDEYVDIDELIKAIEIYSLVIAEALLSEESLK